MFYYVPSPDEAFVSVQHITNDIPFGWFFQKLHSLSATVLIVLVILHMLRVFWHGAFKNPRELHWISGILLLLFTLAMSFTGYLLPWSQLSYWASTVGTEITRSTPSTGDSLVKLIRGTENISSITLKRFYAIHTVGLPLLMSFCLLLHFWMVRKTGIVETQ